MNNLSQMHKKIQAYAIPKYCSLKKKLYALSMQWQSSLKLATLSFMNSFVKLWIFVRFGHQKYHVNFQVSPMSTHFTSYSSEPPPTPPRTFLVLICNYANIIFSNSFSIVQKIPFQFVRPQTLSVSWFRNELYVHCTIKCILWIYSAGTSCNNWG